MKDYNAKKLALLLAYANHGSGIDCDWHISESKRNIIMSNSIHCMDDNGYYEGFMDFSILINKKDVNDIKVKFNTNSFYRRKYADGWREYLNFMTQLTDIQKWYKRPYYLRWDIK